MSPQDAFRAIVGLALAFLSAATAAQSDRIVLSIDQVRSGGENRHEILPVALFDGTRFRPVWDFDPALGARSRRPFLLSNYRRVQVLHRGLRIGVVEVADIHSQTLLFCSLILGGGGFTADMDLPDSEISSSVRGIENGQRVDLTSQAYLALSGATGEIRSDGEPLLTKVTDPAELEAFALDVARFAPRAELPPLGIDDTRAFRFNRHNAVLVVRKRQSTGTVVGPANSEITPPLFTDIVIVRAGAGQRTVLPLSGSGGQTTAFNPGTDDRFVDAFELGNGKVYLVFERGSNAIAGLKLYELGAISETRVVFEVENYRC